MAAQTWLDTDSPPPRLPGNTNHGETTGEEVVDLTGHASSASAAEPSASRVSVPASQNQYCVQPLSKPYATSHSSGVQETRPQRAWVEKTSERLAEQGGESRAAYGPGGATWSGAASSYDRRAKHTPPKHRVICGVEALDESVTAAVARELGTAKTALSITDPAFAPNRFTMVVLGRPVQVFSPSIMCLPCRVFRRLFFISRSHFLEFGLAEHLFFFMCEGTGRENEF